MRIFHYAATDVNGSTVRGIVDAKDWSGALEQLAARGLRDCHQTGIEVLPELSPADAVELAGYLVELSKTGLPLGGTLRALALDATSPALRQVVDQLVTRLETGQSIELALEALSSSLPKHIRRLLVTAARSGRLSHALERLLTHQREIDDMDSRMRQSIAYPLLLLAMLFVWLLVVSMTVMPQVLEVIADGGGYTDADGLQVDSTGRVLALVTSWTPWVLCGGLTAALVTVLSAWIFGGKSALSRLLGLVPLIGPCWRARGMADYTGLLSEFVDAQMTLPEALDLTASGTRDPAVRPAVQRVAASVRHGTGLATAMHRESVFPNTLSQWSDWGQQHDSLDKAVRLSARMFTERFELRLQFLRTMLPAIVFLLMALCTVFVATTVFQAMFNFMYYYTSWHPAPSGPDMPPVWILAGGFLVCMRFGVAMLLVAWLVRPTTFVVEAIATLCRYFGIFFVAVGLLLAFMAIHSYGWVAWILLMVSWIRGVRRYRSMQRQAFWSALSLTAECHAPLAPMAQAFADEQRGIVASSAYVLSQQLAGGADLADALAHSGGAFPAEAALAIRVGTDTGDLYGALRATAGSRRAGKPLMPAAVVWLVLFFPLAAAIFIFAQIKIMPSLVFIYEDFEQVLPPVTLWFIRYCNALVQITPFLLLLTPIVAVLAWLQWRGTMRPTVPVVRRVNRWLEIAPLLRLLALVTQRGQPLDATIASMARLHPCGWIRRRLRTTLRDLERGLPWQTSMCRHRLLSDGELSVLLAAERNGNLSWALGELGDSLERRAEFRLRMLGEFAFPLLVTLVGLFVASFALAYFVPVVNLIGGLT